MVELQIAEEISVLEREEGEKIENGKNKNENEKKKIQKLSTDLNHQKEQLDEYINKYNEDRDCRITPL